MQQELHLLPTLRVIVRGIRDTRPRPHIIDYFPMSPTPRKTVVVAGHLPIERLEDQREEEARRKSKSLGHAPPGNKWGASRGSAAGLGHRPALPLGVPPEGRDQVNIPATCGASHS